MSLVKVTDDSPVNAANRTALADFEPREFAASRVAGDQFMQSGVKHTSAGKANLGPVFDQIRGGAHERKENSDSRRAPVRFDGNQRREYRNGGTRCILPYPWKVTGADCFIPRNAALIPAGAGAAQDYAVRSHILHGLALHPDTHGQHGDENSDSAGYADNDGQNRPDSLCGPREIDLQDTEELPDEIHLV
jgi:hypothetical protein